MIGQSLRSGKSKSCGCLQKDTVRTLRTKHAGSKDRTLTKEYKAWRGIRRRCVTGTAKNFSTYGAAGIGLADEWKDNFAAFRDHIGPAPSAKHSVDRIDNAKGYEPGNVRWATSKDQSRNKRKNIYVNFNGERMLLVDACEMTGTNYYVAYARLRRGKTAFST